MLMRSPAILPLIALLAVGRCLAGCSSVRGYWVSPKTTLLDVDGRPHQPLPGDGVVRVLIFVTNDCPISNSYAPVINTLVADYQPRGVMFFLVHVDRDLEVEKARQHAAEFGFRCTVLMDAHHEVVNIVGATVTPEAALVDAGGRLAYLGRIDDRYIDFGKKRMEPTRRDLQEALQAVLAGQKVLQPRTRAIGCYISGL